MWNRSDKAVTWAVGAVAAVLALTACAPQSPDRSSWTDQAHTAVEDVASEVATVQLLLRLVGEGKVPGKYQQVVSQDSETAVGETLASFGGEQPPPADDDLYRRTTGALSDASDLLADVRIALVRRDTGAYPAMRDELDALQERLSGLTNDLEGPGR